MLNIPDGNDFVAIAADVYHNVALKADGSIVAWGNTDYPLLFDVPDGNDIDINSVTPAVGDYNAIGLVNLSAETFVDCPDVYEFDYWLSDVNDINSPTTTVLVDSNTTVTAVFYSSSQCGDQCHPNDLFGDYDHNCIIDFNDFRWFTNNWMVCTKPECD